jgi:PAS domain S-box-containing protein
MTTNGIGRILVVDDEIELKNIVEAMVTQGYDAAGFTSGEEALAELRDQAFDVLLTELMMPSMDGLTLLRAGLAIDPHLVGIMMIGQGTIQTAVDAMRFGAFDCVLKPFRMQAMLPVLTRAMSTRKLRLENQQLRETVAIHELGQAITFALDPQAIISKLADVAFQQTDADQVSILLPTGKANEFYVAEVRGENRQQLLGKRVSLKDSISGWVARERLPLVLDGEIKDERFHSLWPNPTIRSAISVPMQVGNRLIGTININSLHRSRQFEQEQTKALTILANIAAAAMERAAQQAQVRTAEENDRTIFQNAIEGLFQSTSDGRFIAANPAFAKIFGYESPAEMIDAVTDIARQLYVNPGDRQEAAARLDEAHGFLQGFEFQAYRRDGEKIWLSENRRLVRDQNGAELYIEGSVENITERKRIEEEERKSRQQYESLVHSIDGIVWEMDLPSFTFTFVSPQAERLLGYPPEQWLEEPNFWADHLYAEDRRWVLDYCTHAAAVGVEHEFDYRMIAADGRVVWFRDMVSVDRSNGEGPRLRGVMVDITERKRAEDELRRSEERYRDLVENARDIIYEHDLEGNYTVVNKAGEQVTGYTLLETLRLNLSDLIAPEFIDKARQMLVRKLAGESVTAYELELVSKSGRRMAVEVNSRLVFHDGVPVGVQGIARDVTERKQLEEQLRQSQKLEAIGQLAGGVAHDFNNLLTVIGGYSDLVLQRLPESSPLLASVTEIKKAGDRASALTRQLLAFSRKQMLQPSVLDLNSVVSSLERMLRRLIGENIDLVTITAPDLGQVKADPGQLDQVIINLIVNARDAMPAGGKLTVQTANVELGEEYSQNHLPCVPGNYIMLAVTDTGTGMDAETQSRIFEPFFTTKPAGKGTGLGLSTAYGIVKQSGGNIWVYSEVGKGTIFRIYLPRVDEPADESEVAGKCVQPPPRGSETILLVEDEEQVRQIAQQILTSLGYNVLTATNGQEALAIAQGYPKDIDLTITDVVMPQLGGRELIERLALLRPEMKVLYMSGYTNDAIVRHGLLAEQLQFIQKPFSADGLARKIRNVLDAGVQLL